MGEVEFDAVQACGDRPRRRRTESVDDLFDLAIVHGLRRHRPGSFAQRDLRRCAREPLRVRVKTGVLLERQHRSNPGVQQLNCELGALGMHGLGHPGQRRDRAIVIQRAHRERRGQRGR